MANSSFPGCRNDRFIHSGRFIWESNTSFTLEGEKEQPSMASMYVLSHQIVISNKKSTGIMFIWYYYVACVRYRCLADVELVWYQRGTGVVPVWSCSWHWKSSWILNELFPYSWSIRRFLAFANRWGVESVLFRIIRLWRFYDVI